MDDGSHKSETMCKVCGDKASGKHYGVASCDGCRGFFKRSIRRNLEYICKENGRCIVDVTRRNQCQACRFKKCLQVNMKREAVQHERAPRTTHPSLHPYPLSFGTARFRTLQTAPMFSTLPIHYPANTSLLEHGQTTAGLVGNMSLNAGTISPVMNSGNYLSNGFLYHPSMISGFGKPILAHQGINFSSCLTSPSYLLKSPQNISKTKSPTLTEKNIKDEDQVSSSEEISSQEKRFESGDRNVDSRLEGTRNVDGATRSEENSVSFRLKLPILNEIDSKPPSILEMEMPALSLFAESVYESAAKLLFLAVKWARTIPSFLQLSYRDQSLLLEESWNELFILTAAQWTLPIDEVVLLNNVQVSHAQQSFLEEEVRRLKDVISRLNSLRVDHTEHAYLKALVLFKAECRGLREPTHVEMLQDQTHVMLQEYCTQRQTHKSRFGKLLLTLPSVQSISKRSLEELLFKQTVGDVAIEKLLGDLAKSMSFS